VNHPSREAQAATRPLLGPLATKNMPKLAHMTLDGGEGAVHRDVGESYGDDGVGRMPPVHQNPSTGGPSHPFLETGDDNGGNFGGADSEADQLREGVREEANQIGDGKLQIIKDKVIPIIIGIMRIRRAHVNKDIPAREGCIMMSDGGPDI